jgi:hypothetical protein
MILPIFSWVSSSGTTSVSNIPRSSADLSCTKLAITSLRSSRQMRVASMLVGSLRPLISKCIWPCALTPMLVAPS